MRNLIEKLEEQQELIKDKLEEIFMELAGEIFGVPPALGNNNKIMKPEKPNMEMVDKYFKIRRRFR